MYLGEPARARGDPGRRTRPRRGGHVAPDRERERRGAPALRLRRPARARQRRVPRLGRLAPRPRGGRAGGRSSAPRGAALLETLLRRARRSPALSRDARPPRRAALRFDVVAQASCILVLQERVSDVLQGSADSHERPPRAREHARPRRRARLAGAPSPHLAALTIVRSPARRRSRPRPLRPRAPSRRRARRRAASTCDGVALLELALEEPQRERVLDQPLERPLERPRAVGRIPAGLGDQLLRLVGQAQADRALAEPRAQPGELELDDLAELLARERLELDDLVDPVQELGPEDARAAPRPSGRSRS